MSMNAVERPNVELYVASDLSDLSDRTMNFESFVTSNRTLNVPLV